MMYAPHPTHPGYFVPLHPHHPPPHHHPGYGPPREESPPPRDRASGDEKERDREKEKEKEGKGKGKGKEDKPPPPEKLNGDDWEEPRSAIQLKLLGEECSSEFQSRWRYPLNDVSRRSFAGYVSNALTAEQCKTFFETIRDGTDWKQPEGSHGLIPRKTGWMVKRGCECKYRYGGIEVAPQEFPKWMIELLSHTMKFCGLKPNDWPNSCNLNLYEDGGMTVGWHSDDEKLFQGKFRDCRIISLSLGAERRFELRLNWPEEHERPVQKMMLGSGDLLTMEGMVQKHFQHRVPREENVKAPRINLTWRWVKKHVPQCPAARTRR